MWVVVGGVKLEGCESGLWDWDCCSGFKLSQDCPVLLQWNSSMLTSTGRSKETNLEVNLTCYRLLSESSSNTLPRTKYFSIQKVRSHVHDSALHSPRVAHWVSQIPTISTVTTRYFPVFYFLPFSSKEQTLKSIQLPQNSAPISTQLWAVVKYTTQILRTSEDETQWNCEIMYSHM